MSDHSRSTSPVRRGLGATLCGIGLLMAVPAFAATATHAHHHRDSSEATQLLRETVEQRIHMLHTDLGITSEQEPAWRGVTSIMRRKEAAMGNMVLEQRQSMAQNVSAVDDMLI